MENIAFEKDQPIGEYRFSMHYPIDKLNRGDVMVYKVPNNWTLKAAIMSIRGSARYFEKKNGMPRSFVVAADKAKNAVRVQKVR